MNIRQEDKILSKERSLGEAVLMKMILGAVLNIAK